MCISSSPLPCTHGPPPTGVLARLARAACTPIRHPSIWCCRAHSREVADSFAKITRQRTGGRDDRNYCWCKRQVTKLEGFCFVLDPLIHFEENGPPSFLCSRLLAEGNSRERSCAVQQYSLFESAPGAVILLFTNCPPLGLSHELGSR